MYQDWFRVTEIPMDISTWRKLPKCAGYKFEYIHGQAEISPRTNACDAVLELAAYKPVETSGDRPEVRLLGGADWEALVELMEAAFHRAPPFESLSDEERADAVRDCLQATWGGADGPMVEEACFAAYDRDSGGKGTGLVGANVVTLRKPQSAVAAVTGALVPHLTWIFVHPWQTRRGIGGTLLAASAKSLLKMGYRQIESTMLTANHASVLWHWGNGFKLAKWGW